MALTLTSALATALPFESETLPLEVWSSSRTESTPPDGTQFHGSNSSKAYLGAGAAAVISPLGSISMENIPSAAVSRVSGSGLPELQRVVILAAIGSPSNSEWTAGKIVVLV